MPLRCLDVSSDGRLESRLPGGSDDEEDGRGGGCQAATSTGYGRKRAVGATEGLPRRHYPDSAAVIGVWFWLDLFTLFALHFRFLGSLVSYSDNYKNKK